MCLVELTGPFPTGLLGVSTGPSLVGSPRAQEGIDASSWVGDQTHTDRKQVGARERKQVQCVGIPQRESWAQETGSVAKQRWRGQNSR